MKRKIHITTFILTLLVLLSNIKAGMYFTYYLVDKEGFVEIFCQNKKIPDSHCEGKCKLSKIASESEKTTDFDFNELKSDFNWIVQQVVFFSFLGEENLSKSVFYYRNPYWKTFCYSIFRPPILK